MAIISSHEGEKLVFEASTETGTVELVSGKMFVGGEYPVELLVNGALDSHAEDQGTEDTSDDVQTVSCLVTLYIYSDSTPIRLSQCYPGNPGRNTITLNQTQLINAFRAHGVSRLESIEAEVFVSRVEQVPYEDEDGNALVKEVAHVYAQGKTKIYWSPAIGFEKGVPVDTRGDVGPSGVWVGEEPPPEGSDYLVWVQPRQEPVPSIDYQRFGVADSADRRVLVADSLNVLSESSPEHPVSLHAAFREFLVKKDAVVRIVGKGTFESRTPTGTPVKNVTGFGEVWLEYVHAAAQKDGGVSYNKLEHHPIRIVMGSSTSLSFDLTMPLPAINTASETDSMEHLLMASDDGAYAEWTRYRVRAVAAHYEDIAGLQVAIYITPFGEEINVNKE